MMQLPIETVALADIEDEGRGLTRFRRDLGDLKALKASILACGLACPPVVWRHKTREGNHYVVIDGNRRVASLKELRAVGTTRGLDEVACAVFEGKLLDGARLLSIHLHFVGTGATNTNVMDRAMTVKWMLAIPGATQVSVAAALGITQGNVSQLYALARHLIPEAQGALWDGRIKKERHGHTLAGMVTEDGKPDVERQSAALAEFLRVRGK